MLGIEMKLTHTCEFCLRILGTSDCRREKEARRIHAKYMQSHKRDCPKWNDKAEIILNIKVMV